MQNMDKRRVLSLVVQCQNISQLSPRGLSHANCLNMTNKSVSFQSMRIQISSTLTGKTQPQVTLNQSASQAVFLCLKTQLQSTIISKHQQMQQLAKTSRLTMFRRVCFQPISKLSCRNRQGASYVILAIIQVLQRIMFQAFPFWIVYRNLLTMEWLLTFPVITHLRFGRELVIFPLP